MSSTPSLLRIHLIRHGETEWSRSGRHTSHTDLSLTPRGEEQARELGARLKTIPFSHVFTSPRTRAQQTCRLAGLGAAAVIEADLREWDYGNYEGLTRSEISAARAGWNVFVDGADGGENPREVFARAENILGRLKVLEGDIAVFSHGHFLRVLAVAWAGFPVVHAQRFDLSTASLGILSYDRNRPDSPLISLWNDTGHAANRD